MSISPASASSQGGRIAGMRTAAHRSERPHHGRHARPDFFGNSGDGGPIDIQRLGQACLLDCAPTGAAGRKVIYKLPYGSVRFRTVQTTFSLVKVSLWT